MNGEDRKAYKDWEAFKRSIEKATDIDTNESIPEQALRLNMLKGDIVAFAKYYFPHYCKSDFAKFQKRFFNKAIDNDRCFIALAVARSHAKSVCAGVILPLYLLFTGRMKNMLLVSYNETNAIELLTPIKLELESNQRLLHDFGEQRSLQGWEAGKFITRSGCSFRAIGTGQSPRGSRNQEARPDYILCDDVDEDEMARNPKRMDDAWDWIRGALYGCFDITGSGRFVVVGNIIAKNSLVMRAMGVSNYSDQVNILHPGKRDELLVSRLEKQLNKERDENEHRILTEALNYARDGWEVSWKERFTLLDCVRMIYIMGYRISQREYFNNPFSEGKVFKSSWFVFRDDLPPLSKYRFLVAYLDPGFKNTKTSDSKALVLVGLHEGKFHVRKCFVSKASVQSMIEWGYSMDAFVKARNGSYIFKMEQVFLQDLLYKDFSEAAKSKGYPLPVMGDTRKKPDKDSRIEATSGYYERGDVYYDAAIEKDHHTQELLEQYLCFEKGVKTKKDGPDAMEGAFYILQSMVSMNYDGVSTGERSGNKNRL